MGTVSDIFIWRFFKLRQLIWGPEVSLGGFAEQLSTKGRSTSGVRENENEKKMEDTKVRSCSSPREKPLAPRGATFATLNFCKLGNLLTRSSKKDQQISDSLF